MNSTDKADEEHAQEIARLIRDLQSYRVSVRVRAIDALLLIGEPAVKPLIDAYQALIADHKQDPGEFRWVIAKALAEIGGEEALGPLLHSLKYSGPYIRWTIAVILGRVGDQRAADELISALKDEDRDVRRLTIHALGQLQGERVLEALIQSLGDDDRYVRREAAAMLGKTGDQLARDALQKALKTETQQTTQIAIRRALENLEDRKQ